MLIKMPRGNQVTIPKDIVKKAHLREGNEYLDAEYVRGVICLKPVDVEERVSDEVYEKLLRKASALEPGDVAVSSKEAGHFLRKRAKA